jgi:phosphosulfolactate synthase (CoM biosynthesis protein A)
MKNTFLIIIVSFLAINISNGQQRIKEKIKSNKVAYISEQLNLTEIEAQKFWPIYNAYQDEMEANRASQNIRYGTEMTDAQADELMENMLILRTKEIEIQRKYIKKFKTAIPSKKVANLFRSEKEFQGKVISKIKERSGRGKG